MKTAEEKAKEFVVRWNIRAEASYELELLLKEQDRDTRHACAEAVLKLAHTERAKGSGVVGQMQDSRDEGYNSAIDAAHDACINVKAV